MDDIGSPQFKLWADIGGTFTDCIVTDTRSFSAGLSKDPLSADARSETGRIGRSKRSTLKLLSSGLVSAEVVEVLGPRQLRLRLPRAYSLPSFWVTARLSLASTDSSTLANDSSQVATTRRATTRVIGWHQLGPDGSQDNGSRDQASVGSGTVGDAVVEAIADLQASVKGSISIGDRVTLDAGLEAPVLAARFLLGRPLDQPLPNLQARLGTTRGTNALLTRGGARTALLVTEGLADILQIGTQERPSLFALDIVKPTPLACRVVEIPGRLDADGAELIPVSVDEIRVRLAKLRQEQPAVETVAICLLHAHRNDSHERKVASIATEVGFDRVVRSTRVAAVPRLVPRAETTTLDAYLQPVLEDYVARVWEQLGGPSRCHLRWMTSGGNLVSSEGFHGRDCVLSGPAGGVVALGEVARRVGLRGAVGLDMGGTSTDVSRYEGGVGRRHESQVSGIRIASPMMDIHTVAAGGGSICAVRDGRLTVGPDSAGADPGPACYGRGGPLTVTDLNLLLGRLREERFPFPLRREAAQQALLHWHRQLPDDVSLEPLELAEGWLQIAVTQMAEAVRVVTTAAGSDPRQMALVGFGGAAGGHLCQVADALEMTRLIDHPQAGLLSAVGIGVAPIGRITERALEIELAGPIDGHGHRAFSAVALTKLTKTADALRSECASLLELEEGISADWFVYGQHPPGVQPQIEQQVEVRYAKTQSTISVPLHPIDRLVERFEDRHQRLFGYRRHRMPIEATAVRCEMRLLADKASIAQTATTSELSGLPSDAPSKLLKEVTARWTPADQSPCPPWPKGKMVVQGRLEEVSLVQREHLSEGMQLSGPAIVSGEHSVLVVEPGWRADVLAGGWIDLKRVPSPSGGTSRGDRVRRSDDGSQDDAIAMELVTRRVQGIAEAMGEVIRRTSVSVNVKERRDYSCAVFLGDGSLIANAPHVPVHLGAMGHTVRDCMATYPKMFEGDVYVSNDPYAGGSHLPDVTTMTPVFCPSLASVRPSDWPCDFFVASRCHHAEIGGMVPGSMAPQATCLADEGILIRQFALVREGRVQHEELERHFQSGPYPSRSVAENMADIAAAEAAGREGAAALQRLAEAHRPGRVTELLQRLLNVAGQATSSWIESLGPKTRTFADQLDDGTPIQVALIPDQRRGRLAIDFSGTGAVHPHGFNATESIVTAAILYTLRCVAGGDLPLCDGVLRQIDLRIPAGLLSPPRHEDPVKCPAVVAGNVETSNRIVDVLLGALGVAAASQGTMNNLLIGDETFGYYETIAGGAGATPYRVGADAVHTHMTNTRITDPEVLESRLPVRLWQFAIRRGSGGQGKYRGGDGVIRELEFLRPLTVSMLTSRRVTSPYGASGGRAGKKGQQQMIEKEGVRSMPPCFVQSVMTGDRLRIETPGGGGWGAPMEPSVED